VNCDGHGHVECGDVKEARQGNARAEDHGSCGDHIKRERSAEDVGGLDFADRQERADRCHRQHGGDENVSGDAVTVGAFAEGDGDGLRCRRRCEGGGGGVPRIARSFGGSLVASRNT
jgi:hypothetical protein